MATDIKQEYRGDGTSTKQMQGAPKDAIYIVPYMSIKYHKDLAIKSGREDLKIVSEQWLINHRWVGLNLSGIVLDHAYIPNHLCWNIYKEALTRIKK